MGWRPLVTEFHLHVYHDKREMTPQWEEELEQEEARTKNLIKAKYLIVTKNCDL